MKPAKSLTPDPRQGVPKSFRLAALLLFRPLDLWLLMVLWRLDGDPALVHIWRSPNRIERAWMKKIGSLILAAVGFVVAVLYVKAGSASLATIAACTALLLAGFFGLAFAAALSLTVAIALCAGILLDAWFDIAAIDILIMVAIGHGTRVGLRLQDRVFDDPKTLRIGRHDIELSPGWPLFLTGIVTASYYSGTVDWLGPVGGLVAGYLIYPTCETLRARLAPPFLFLSYRHADELGARLVRTLHALAPERSFLDVEMGVGREWQFEILAALRRATILLVPNPPSLEPEPDGTGEVQDRDNFHVLLECGYAERRIPVAEVYFDPEKVQDSARQVYIVRVDHWQEDVQRLVDNLRTKHRLPLVGTV